MHTFRVWRDVLELVCPRLGQHTINGFQVLYDVATALIGKIAIVHQFAFHKAQGGQHAAVPLDSDNVEPPEKAGCPFYRGECAGILYRAPGVPNVP
jgi:hypothetical protein